MLKKLVCACTALLIIGFGQFISAQEPSKSKVNTVNPASNDRDQDGLNGPVRRVRVDSSKIIIQNGKPVEGPKVLREITTYDITGRRIDTVAHPVEGSSLPGKEEYKYDDKGNIKEMVLRGNDGSILSKEIYAYEYDQFGNWKKMTTSVGTYEDGKLGFEPIEISYRTITYYYAQAVDKMTHTAQPGPAPTPLVPTPVATKASVTTPAKETAEANSEKPAANEGSTLQTVANAKDTGAMNAAASSSPAQTENRKAPDVTETTSETTAVVNKPASEAPAKVEVKQVSEEMLRAAAIILPQAEYPAAAKLAGVQGRVEVEVIVDEKGEVRNARATSGQDLLTEAAEDAARAARFTPGRLTQNSARAFGVISYDFVPPNPMAAAPAPALNVVTEETKTAPAASATPPDKKSNPGPPVVASPNNADPPKADSPQSGILFYRQGLSYLASGRNTEAVDAFKRAVLLNPDDSMAYVKLGICYSALGQHKEAVAVFKMAMSIKPQILDPEGYYQLGQSYTALGKYSEALNAFKQALYVTRGQNVDPDQSRNQGSFPTPVELHYGLGLAYHNTGRYNDAVKELKQVINLNPQLAEGYYGLALAYLGLGDRSAAERQQKILSSLKPDLAEKLNVALSSRTRYSTGLPPGILPPGVTRGRP